MYRDHILPVLDHFVEANMLRRCLFVRHHLRYDNFGLWCYIFLSNCVYISLKKRCQNESLLKLRCCFFTRMERSPTTGGPAPHAGCQLVVQQGDFLAAGKLFHFGIKLCSRCWLFFFFFARCGDSLACLLTAVSVD